jgi:voltage-gated potassium channel
VWKRGHFEPSRFDTRVDANTVLVLVGSKEHLAAYDARYSQYGQHEASIVILGGGRVGQATARTLAQGHRDYRIVDKDPGRIEDDDRGVVGDAADLEVLKRAGIDQARTVIVTTHDDDVNVYLTVYCRKLRPDAQIIARATRERTIASLHRAGADFVLSYASMGASAMLNLLKQDKVLLVAEGARLLPSARAALLGGHDDRRLWYSRADGLQCRRSQTRRRHARRSQSDRAAAGRWRDADDRHRAVRAALPRDVSRLTGR